MATNPPLLDLTTLVDAAHIRIDGTLYPLRQLDQMSLAEIHRLNQGAPEFIRFGERLESGSDVTAGEMESYSATLRALTPIVLDAPVDVHDRLTDSHRIAIMTTFMQLRTGKPSQPTGATEQAQGRPTGGSTSRVFSGSMAATRRGGSRGSR